MTRNSRRQFACLIVIVITIVGCNKVADFLRSHKDGDMKYCNIKKIKFAEGSEGPPHEYTFTYNAQGNPVSAIVDNIGTTWPDRYFFYDNKNRLTKHIGLYNSVAYETWTLYYHDAKGRIIRDTTWHWGQHSNGEMVTTSGYTYSVYDYDKWDRLIKVSVMWDTYPNAPPLELDYEYDPNGNLVLDKVVYDNKINFKRTNKVWMFLNRDYSVNNTFRAKTYNKNNLPLKLDTGRVNKGIFFTHNLEHGEIEYMCK